MKFELLQPKLHDRQNFDCGDSVLNRYLRQFAQQDQSRDLSRVYVLADAQRIIGYYSISACSVARDELPDSTRIAAYRELPFILLGRLAVDKQFQGQGYGDALMMHAFKTTNEAAEKVGIFGMIVDAKHERAAEFYQKFGFRRLSATPNRLALPFSAIRKAI